MFSVCRIWNGNFTWLGIKRWKVVFVWVLLIRYEAKVNKHTKTRIFIFVRVYWILHDEVSSEVMKVRFATCKVVMFCMYFSILYCQRFHSKLLTVWLARHIALWSSHTRMRCNSPHCDTSEFEFLIELVNEWTNEL